MFIAIIVVLAFILLMIAFRSLLVPLTAVIGFLLSVAASLGVMVWVFQYGHFGGLVARPRRYPSSVSSRCCSSGFCSGWRWTTRSS